MGPFTTMRARTRRRAGSSAAAPPATLTQAVETVLAHWNAGYPPAYYDVAARHDSQHCPNPARRPVVHDASAERRVSRQQSAALLAELRSLLREITETEAAVNRDEIDPGAMGIPDLLASLHAARKLLHNLQRLYADRPS